MTVSYLISTEREAVLHSAHREEAPGAEEEAEDVLGAAVLHLGQHQPGSHLSHCGEARTGPPDTGRVGEFGWF